MVPRCKTPPFFQAQKELEKFRMRAWGTSNIDERRKHQDNRNRYKKTIKRITFFFAKHFLRKIPKLWNKINRVLNKQQNPIKQKPSEINKDSSYQAANFINKENVESSYETLANNLPTENCSQSFRIRHINCNEVNEIYARLKNDFF